MIICDRYKFIYVGIPKNATTSLHHWLSQPVFCDTRWTPEKQDQHNTHIPHDKIYYDIIVSIRHPFERLISLWKQFTSPSSVAKVEGCYKCTIDEFIKALPTMTEFFRLGQADWINKLPKVDYYIRCSCLVEDLQKFAWSKASTEEIPHKNRTRHDSWNNLLSGHQQVLIKDLWFKDWELPF